EKSAAVQAEEGDTKRKKKTEEVLNAFPHMDLRFTVFGQYQNLRAFLNEIEHNKQFFVVKAVNFTLQEDKGGGGGGGGGRAQRAHASVGAGLIMSIDAAAYFQP